MKKKILSYLLKKRINFWEMTSRMSYLPDFVSVLKKMEKEGLIKIKNSYLLLTQKGKRTASALKIIPQSLPSPDICEIKIDKKLLKNYKNFRRNKVFEKEEFDQLQLSEEGVLKKIEVMRRFDDLKDKKIICLGDDDLVGIALALTKEPKEIMILDIDKEIIDYENNVLEKLGYKKSAFLCDFLKPIPQRFRGKYDVFITEPPDTVKGITLFFSRGIECLSKKGGIAYLGVSKTDLDENDFLKIEENILKMKGLITDIFSHFEGYKPSKIDFSWVFGLPKGVTTTAREPWFFSDLLRVKILKGAVPLLKGKKGKKFRENFIKTEIFL
ncbi:MAG: N(4)-bis(aminopropyl)spermidine synthase [Syntrophomonadaceae bacterium]|nr:N(4)-bis(aminopropyl)spermidine synthase [Bacillota bacterium]